MFLGMLVTGATGPAVTGPPDGAVAQITTLLLTQRDAWNRGDLEAFLVPYWPSEKLTFYGGGEARLGLDATRRRYKERYGSDRASMGQLSFDGLDVELLAESAALVRGRWAVLWPDAKQPAVGGLFTLVVRKIEGHWKIVHDHTSAR